MHRSLIHVLGSVVAISFVGAAQADEPKMESSHPCFAIKKACEDAGFKPGQHKDGTGLWKDCVDRLVKGEAAPNAAKLQLPTVEAKTIEACKAKHQAKGHVK